MKRSILPFLPVLAFHVFLVIFWGNNSPFGDETRYLTYANNLTNGFFVIGDNPIIHSGPGYPLVIAPFIALGIPLMFIRLLNVVFLAGTLFYLRKTFETFLSPSKAIFLVYLFAFYPTLLKWMPRIYAEALALFFLSAFMYHVLSLFQDNRVSSIHLLYSGFFLGGLALTKYIFIYVIIASIILYGAGSIATNSKALKMVLSVFLMGFLIYLPFVVNNFLVTHQVLLTGTNGAEIFYWRSTPYENEFGDWIAFDEVIGKRETLEAEDLTQIRKHHLEFIHEVYFLPLLERNKRLKKKALENIRANPLNYMRNTGASFVRLFFNYPRSYEAQKLTTFFHLIPGSILFYFTFIGVFIALKKRKEIPIKYVVLFSLGIIYLGGLTLLNGNARNLLCIIPLLFLFNAYIWHAYIKINIT